MIDLIFTVVLIAYCMVTVPMLKRSLKKSEKDRRKIARQEARKKHVKTVYVPIDTEKVVSLSDYRTRRPSA